VITLLAKSLGLNFTNLRPIVGNTFLNMHVLMSVGMVISRRDHHYIRIPGVGHLFPTPMPNHFSIGYKILHYLPQEGDTAFDQEVPEPEEVDEDELATDEEEEQPQDDAPEDVPYTIYADIYNLEGSINNMSNLAESLQDTSLYMTNDFSEWRQGWALNYQPPQ
jgi:hypothetical protein